MIDKNELKDCVSMYIQDVVDWSMCEWIAHQMGISEDDVQIELDKNSKYKQISKLLDRG